MSAAGPGARRTVGIILGILFIIVGILIYAVGPEGPLSPAFDAGYIAAHSAQHLGITAIPIILGVIGIAMFRRGSRIGVSLSVLAIILAIVFFSIGPEGPLWGPNLFPAPAGQQPLAGFAFHMNAHRALSVLFVLLGIANAALVKRP